MATGIWPSSRQSWARTTLASKSMPLARRALSSASQGRRKVAAAGCQQAEGRPATVVAEVDLDQAPEGIAGQVGTVAAQLDLPLEQQEVWFLAHHHRGAHCIGCLVEAACLGQRLGQNLDRRDARGLGSKHPAQQRDCIVRRAPRRGGDGLPAGCREERPKCLEVPGWRREGRPGVPRSSSASRDRPSRSRTSTLSSRTSGSCWAGYVISRVARSARTASTAAGSGAWARLGGAPRDC